MRPVMFARQNPSAHCLFAASRWGTAVHMHATVRPLKSGPRKGALTVDHERVNGKTYAAGVHAETGLFMARTKSSLVMSDCEQMNHCRLVKEDHGEFGVKVHPSAGHPHNIVGGVAPYSHDLSIEDVMMFGIFQ